MWLQGRGRPRYVSTQERREGGGAGLWVHGREGRGSRYVSEQKGKEVGRMHRGRGTGTFGCPEGREVGGRCWFAEEGDRERRGERCVYTCE